MRQFLVVALLIVAAVGQPFPQASQPKFRIVGITIDSVNNNPLPNIEVTIFQRQSLIGTTTSDAKGRFAFAGLTSGKYGLSARGPGYLQQAYEQHGRFTTAIVVGGGIESDNLTFRLKPESSISGTVSDEFNDPVEGAEVFLFKSAHEQGAILLQHRSKTSDNGIFYFGGLPEGKYYLVVVAHPWYAHDTPENNQASSADGELENLEKNGSPLSGEHGKLDVAFPTTYYANATDPGEATPIALKPGENATFDFHLAAIAAVRLKVRGVPVFENATAPLKLSEQIFGFSRLVTTRPMDQHGVELTGLAPGHYLIEYPPRGTSQPEQQPFDLITDIEIAPGEGTRLASSVSGIVQLATEGICQRCRVLLIHYPSYQIYIGHSGAKGFEIAGGVRPGRYLVLVDKQEGYSEKNITAMGAVVNGTELEIQAGSTVRMTIGMTKDVGTIGGVAIRDSKPASAVAIYLVPDDPAHNFALFRADQSDSDGSFEINNAIPGSYTLIAVADGWGLDTTISASYTPYLARGVKVQVRAGKNPPLKPNVQTKAGSSN